MDFYFTLLLFPDTKVQKKVCDGSIKLEVKTEKVSAEETEKNKEEICTTDSQEVTNNTSSEERKSTEGKVNIKMEVNDIESTVELKVAKTEGLSVDVKTEPGDSKASNQIDEPKPDCQKSPSKGIWRPFSFDDVENCPSSSGVAQFIEIKTEQYSNNPNSSTSLNFLKPDLQSSKFLLHDQNVKKCSIQLEPLDLSCGKKSDTEKDKENPYFCKYCRVHYHSGFCLFYRKMSSENPPDPPCYCCDEEDEKDPLSPEVDGKLTDESEKSAAKVPITNPGWFGKGCRKKIRKKR